MEKWKIKTTTDIYPETSDKVSRIIMSSNKYSRTFISSWPKGNAFNSEILFIVAKDRKIKIEKERTKDIKSFLRKEQAILRIEQADRQRQFLKQLQLEKQIEKFRIREVKELEKLEKI